MGQAEISKLMETPMKKKLKELQSTTGGKKQKLSQYNWGKMNFQNFFDEIKYEI